MFRSITILIFCVLLCSSRGYSQCSKNDDNLYDREKTLRKIDLILRSSIPAYAQFPQGFFIYDLSNPLNRFIPKPYANAKACINFINKHVYHVSPIQQIMSQSHIVFLEDGDMRVFKNINCGSSSSSLGEVIAYASIKYARSKNKDEIMTRIKNYRRYGFYLTVDSNNVSCSDNSVAPKNLDDLYDRDKILRFLAGELIDLVPENEKKKFPLSRFLVENSRAIGFFIYDLTEPSNKQTSLTERIEFKNRHIYHFALIDLPFSSSNFVFLQDGKLIIFKQVNCSESQLKKANAYFKENLPDDKGGTLNRIMRYRDYGVYASFGRLLKPQCKAIR